MMIMALSWLWYHNHNHDSITIDRIIMMMGIVMITMVMMTIQDNHQNDNDDGNRFLPPDGMPSARRTAQDGDRLPCRLRGDARPHRQLCFHLPWLVPPPLSYTWTKCLPMSQKLLAWHPFMPIAVQSNCTLCKSKCDNYCWCVSSNLKLLIHVVQCFLFFWTTFWQRMRGFLKIQGGSFLVIFV